MNIRDILSATHKALSKLSKNRILKELQSLRERYVKLEDKVKRVEAENQKLKDQIKKRKIKSVNKNVNRPSSKQPE